MIMYEPPMLALKGSAAKKILYTGRSELDRYKNDGAKLPKSDTKPTLQCRDRPLQKEAN
jgi:hypothetical protein